MDLDEKDRRLLALLERDCRLSNAELAEKVGMSTSACWRRVRAFEEAGLIERYGAVLRPEALGLSFHAIVHVQLTRHDPARLKEFITAVTARDEVRECYATTGQADYHLRVRCRNINEYNRFLEDFLFTMPAVRSAQTNVILRDLKR
ncbi:MAG: Lrp/AsnC family transcriptional regulator [Paracoccaceae bacterium]